MKQEYIGDSVYAELDSDMIHLTTDNGTGASNSIYLEREVFFGLVQFAKSCWDLSEADFV